MKDLFSDLQGKPSLVPEQIAQLVSEIRAAYLSYCGSPKLENVADAILQIQREKTQGLYLEAGVALGGSAILLARLKPANVSLRLFDVFGMIPPPGDSDGEDAHRRYDEIRSGNSPGLGGQTYYGYVDNLLETVKGNLRRFGIDPERDGVEFFPGLFQDTLRLDGPVAFAHIDCDWYDSVKTCIERIAPWLSPGGIMVFDDYSSYSGCGRAVDEFLASNNTFEIIFHKRSLGMRRRLT